NSLTPLEKAADSHQQIEIMPLDGDVMPPSLLAKRPLPARRLGRSLTGLTEGYKLIETKKIPLFFPSFDSLVNVAVYKIRFQVSQEQIQKFLSQPEIIIEKKKGNEIRKIDVKPLILELKTQDGFINLKLRFGPKYNVKSEKIVQSLCSLDENSAKILPVTRTGFLIEKKDGTVLEP
ncbi:MAG: DUF2344 domain-containing protein, partial [Elusimicrobia bacterium]|nr:DUF2344 domain-containing protein [Elusimicrobiota bacterium]